MKTTSRAIACWAAALLPSLVSLGQTPTPAPENHTLNRLIEMTNNPKPDVRLAAAMALQGLGPKGKTAVPALTRLLSDQDGGVRRWAAFALCEIGPDPKTAVAPLTKMLDDPDWDVREAGAVTLGKIGPEAKMAVPGLTKMLSDKELVNRNVAVYALEKIDPEAVAAAPVPAIAKLLGGEDLGRETLKALTQSGRSGKAAVPVLIGWLKKKDANSSVRIRAIRALGHLGPEAKEAIPDLIEMLHDRSPPDADFYTTANAAFDALCEMGPSARKVLPQLIKFVNDFVYPVVRDRPEEMKKVGSSKPAMVNAIVQWLHIPASSSARSHAEKLWSLLGEEDIPSITFLLRSNDASDRSRALDKLREFKAAAVPALVELLEKDDSDLRRSALEVLRDLDAAAKDTVPALVPLLNEHDPDIRQFAFETLRDFGPAAKQAVPAIVKLLRKKLGSPFRCGHHLGANRARCQAGRGVVDRVAQGHGRRRAGLRHGGPGPNRSRGGCRNSRPHRAIARPQSSGSLGRGLGPGKDRSRRKRGRAGA